MLELHQTSEKLTVGATFSVLVPWCNRPELESTLIANRAFFQVQNVEILIINCGGDSEQLGMLTSTCDIDGLRLIEIPTPRFNKSLALNIAILLSRAPQLFILDADIVLESNVFVDAARFVDANAFVTIERVSEVKPAYHWNTCDSGSTLDELSPISFERINDIEFHWRDGTSTRLETSHENIVDGTRAGPGLLIVKKENLLQIEGYNSDLEYWGWEDTDVQLRLTRLLKMHNARIGTVTHLSHTDNVRVLDMVDRTTSNLRNLSTVCSRYAQNNYFGSYSRDVMNWASKLVEVAR
jgi:glycosyltransferase involved in cell wall biosynthesis